MVEIAYDWTEGVDWGNIDQLTTDFHIHPWYFDDGAAHDAIDHVCTEFAPTPHDADERTGYDTFGLSSIGTAERTSDLTNEEYQGKVYWPWTDPDWRMVREDAEEHPESRDPESLDVVAFPCREIVGGSVNHFNQLFGQTGDGSAIPADGWGVENEERLKAVDWVIDDQNGRVIHAHPHTWWDNASLTRLTEFVDQDPEYALGMEIVNFTGESLDLWDQVNTIFARKRGRPVWGYGASDLKSNLDPGDEGMRWETVLLVPEGSVSPTAQSASRDVIENAFVEAHALTIRRDAWNDDTESAPQVPSITNITGTDTTINIDADNWTEIDWISSGEVVETGDTIEVTGDHSPTVRAHLKNGNDPEGETFTQPWLLSNPNTLGRATVGDAQL